MNFKKNVKILCIRKDITLVKLAENLNMSKQNLNRILNINNPTADLLIKISDIFDVSIDELIRTEL